MSDRPLTAAQLQEALQDLLDPVLSSRRTAEAPALALADCTRPQQEFVLRWVAVVVRTNTEMGYQFAGQAARAVRRMDLSGVERWLIEAMDVYDRQGLYSGRAVLAEVDEFARQLAREGVRVDLASVAGVFTAFLQGLAGRSLKIESGERCYTDTECLYLPESVSRFPTAHDNFLLYKCLVTYCWAQTWFGTFRPHPDGLSGFLAGFPDSRRARRLLERLEAVRLNACIARQLTGAARDMRELQAQVGPVRYPDSWKTLLAKLREPAATVSDSRAGVQALYSSREPLPAAFCYQAELIPETTEAVQQARQQRELQALRHALKVLLRDAPLTATDPATTAFRVSAAPARDPFREPDIELRWGDLVVAISSDLKSLLQSVLQDFGAIAPQHLVPAGSGGYDPAAEYPARAENVWQGTCHEQGALLYKEWDFRRQHYRKNWCALREIPVHPSEEPLVQRTLQKHSSLVKQLRRTFEALRGEDKLLKKQREGDEVDLDAVVEAFADSRAGMEMSQDLFVKLRKLERDMAVVLMVDMSGSTKGWINDAERESLVLLCEALEVLGDRYAIYGFSGVTRKRCELYRVKSLTEGYDDNVKRRIAGIKPQDYTRMGVVIRHLTGMLDGIDARTKLLITLSDGRPDDYDGYCGEYGIEDTRRALIEAKYRGVNPFCITIDSEAHAYLPRMYGAVNYVVVDDVRRLPLQVSDIYRRLTT